MEDADDLVDRRVIDLLLVAFVQAGELRRDDPERNHEEEHAGLEEGMCVTASARNELGEQECED